MITSVIFLTLQLFRMPSRCTPQTGPGSAELSHMMTNITGLLCWRPLSGLMSTPKLTPPIIAVNQTNGLHQL